MRCEVQREGETRNMAAPAEHLRISQVGLAARSPEGHAAKGGMAIKGNEDMWVHIQANTFRNWVNEHLKTVGLVVRDLDTDFCDGTKLVALVEILQKRQLRHIKRPANPHQYLENVTTALNAVAEDGVKLVNIGNVDIVNGNLKLILGLIWSLIVRYQIGRSKFPPRKLMLAWLKAVLPECRVANFTSDWNSGVCLSALLEYCRPGLYPHWRELDPNDSVNNCRRAMEIAQREFAIPLVLEPEYLASPHLDELSGMTYLSYFMKEDSPGFHATLRWVNSQLPESNVRNFTRDWNSGMVLCHLVRSLGGPIPGYKQLTSDQSSWENNLSLGIKGGQRLGVEPILKSKDMADQNVEHLGVMAYAAHFQWIRPRQQPSERLAAHWTQHTSRINKTAQFRIECLEGDVSPQDVVAEVIGPSGKVDCRLNMTATGGNGNFTPSEIGMFQLFVYCEGELIQGCPTSLRIMPDITTISYHGMEPCAIGSIVEVLVNSNGANAGQIDVVARSPTGRELACPVNERDGVYTANFQPDEAGEWSISITHGGENIQGGPYTCFVFDPNGIKLTGLEGGVPGQSHSFMCDTSGTGGLGDVVLDVVLSGRSIPHQVEELGPSNYRVTFLPAQPGKYKVYVYFNGAEIRGSAFSMRIGSYRSRHQSSSRHNSELRTEHVTASGGMSGSRGSPKSTEVLHSGGHSRTSPSAGISRLSSSRLSPSMGVGRAASPAQASPWVSSSQGLNSSSTHASQWATTSSSHYNGSSSTQNIASEQAQPPWRRGVSVYVGQGEHQRASPSPMMRATSPPSVKVNSATHLTSSSSRNEYFRSPSPMRATSPPSVKVNSTHLTSTSSRNEYFRSPSPMRATSPPTVKVNSIHLTSNSSKNEYFRSPSPMRATSPPSVKVNSTHLTSSSRNEYFRSPSPMRATSPPAVKVTPATPVVSSTKNDYFHDSGSRVTSFMESRTVQQERSGRMMQSSPPPPPPPQIRSSPLLSAVNGRGGPSPTILGPSALRATPSPSPLDQSRGLGHVDTSSNVRVSSMLNNLNQRRDSWDAIAKTKSMLSYGSLESVANLTAAEKMESRYTSSMLQQQSSETSNNYLVNNSNHQQRTSSPPSGLASQVSASGDALKLVALHRQASIKLQTPGLDPMDISATIKAPSFRNVPCSVSRGRADDLTVFFTPTEIGEHVIELKVGDSRIPGSPFRTHAYNSQAIQVARIPDGFVGQAVEFEIDGSHAGSGNLEILVNGGHVTSFVRDLGAQRFLASFVPHEAGAHLVEMAFNSEQVPGSPWQVGVMAATASSPGPTAPLAQSPNTSSTLTGKMTVLGDAVRLVACGASAAFELSAAGFSQNDIDVQIISPSKRPVTSRLTEQGSGQFRVQFSPKEVGSHLVEVSVGGRSMPGGPLVAKVYNAALIRVSDVGSGVVGQPCQFRVDASQAGEGQLEISVNEGEVPNHVAVVGGGRCLVSFTPEAAKPHLIDIKFNGEAVPGCPFVCPVSDTSRVSLTLRNLELIPVNETARFHIAVDGSGSAELAVSVRGPSSELPVKVTGNVHAGFSAEFTPREVGAHSVTVEYNGHPVAGTPFIAKAYDAKRVFVGPVPRGSVGKALQFTVDASQAGEGNLEITISARGHNIPTQVHPQGNARFAVSFIPLEATDHVISINFNKAPVPGSPFMARVVADPHHIIVSGQNLSSAAVGKPAHFTMSNVAASLDEIEVNVEGPNGQSVAAQVKDSGSQTFRVEFSPRTAGEHRISVAVAAQPVAGSPFACKAYDVKAIRVKEAARGSVGRPVTFLVETSQAGPGNLEVTVNGGRVPTSAQAQGPHTYAISFTPREAAPHTVELRFNGEDVPGSPFTAEVVEAARIMPGAEEKVPVGRSAQFWVQAAAAQGRPTVMVLSPSRRNLPVTLTEPNSEEENQRANQLSASFTPDEVGDHSVEVKIGETHVEGSPFLLKAYDAAKVKVTDVQSGVVGKPVFFSINASQAGAGNLEIIVSVGGRNVPNYVQSEGNARFRVNFKPQEAAPHLLSVRFNGELVPGSPFTCRVLDAGQVLVSGSALRQAPISRPALLTIDPQGAPVQECVVTVLAPSGQNVPTVISGSAQDKFVATFTPFEVGRHAVSIVIDSEHVKGSPFASNIYDVSQVRISGLKPSSVVGHPVTFSVDAAEAGEGTLELVVSTAQGTVKAEVAACARGLYQVTFVPPRPDPHFVHISFNEDDVPGSPFECDVQAGGGGEGAARMATRALTVRGEGLHQAVVGAPAFFDVDPGGTRSDESVEVEIMGPDGLEIPVRVVRVAAGRCRAEYRPHHIGAHQVWVRRGGVTAADSPFEVEVFDPSQASITHVTEAICNQPANFTVDMSRAGRGALSVSVKAAGRDVKAAVRDIGHGRHEVSFLPTLATPHRVDVRLNGLHIAGCPMEIAVRDSVSGREILASGRGLYQAEAGREASFTIETLGHSAREFDVVVSGPGGIAVPVRCYQQKDGNLLAQFTPPGAGSYKVEVLHGAKPLRSSPFFCQAFEAARVRITGLGNRSVAVHDPISFQVLRKGAGFAELDVTVISPLGQNLPLAVRSGDQPESDLIEFRPSAPGQYRFCIRYGGEEVPGSPVTFVVAEEGSVIPGIERESEVGTSSAKAQTNGNGEVRLSGPGLEGSRVGKETYFTIDGSLAGSGIPEATMSGDGGKIPIHVADEGKNVYRASFTAPESGNYKLLVKWAGREVRGSPFSILVSAVADASRVVCSGEGLRVGTVGKEIRSFLDTRRAGPGELTAQCVGPNKVAYCELYDHGDGTFTLNVKPQEAGKHALSIKYGGQHAPGSPFTLRVAGAPDASKVRVFGPGIEHGVLATFQSRFVCDTRGAGAGQLTVRIRGPKGAFRVEMQRESQRDRAILCKYEPTEPGDYRLEVRWAGQHVPGSPFAVMIFDTQDELNRFAQGNHSPSGGPALSELYGSVGYSTGYAHMNFSQPSWRGSQAQL